MTTQVARTPAVSFHPGEFLKDSLDDYGWSQTEFAEIIGRAPRVVNEIILGKRAITPETASEFAAALGTTAQYWLNLETAYQLSKAPPVSERIAQEAELRKRFPVREMTKRGWLNLIDGEDVSVAVCRYFGISSASDNLDRCQVAWRKSGDDVSINQLAWLVRVKQLAEAFSVPKYSETKLRESITTLENLLMDPEEVRHVPRILADCGVRFIIVEPLPSSKIDGVCFWLDKNRSPVIGLSLKGSDQIDRFWFNLRHEIEHVLRYDGRDEPVIDNFEDTDEGSLEPEIAANNAAADFCVPKAMMDSFIRRHHPIYSKRDLIGFSRLVHRHPGIVAGQIQKKLDRWDLFKQYQVKIRHIVVSSALTDGYGIAPQILE
jgi:HTH-type transcriptional regulator/antitoxin HigA